MRPYFYLGEDRGLTQLSEGQPFYVYTRDRSITPWILLGGIWETFVDDILCALVRPGDVFLDVGANQGYYTVKIGSRVGTEGRVFSFEPNPAMLAFLRDNIEINALQPRVTAVAAGAGAEPGLATLSIPENYPGGAAILATGDLPPPAQQGVQVHIVRVDDVVPSDVSADLIKIDVEGFEPAALEGMSRLLARSPACPIVCELSVAGWRRFGEPASLLRKFAGKRRVFHIHTDGGLEELTDLAALDQTFVNYVLLLPPTPEREAQVARFIRPTDGHRAD